MVDLGQLIEVLKCSLTTRQRDRVVGTKGWIYAEPEGFYFYYEASSVKMWNIVKKEMAFCLLSQDGDSDGVMLLNRLPTEPEAEIIRQRLGIRKRKIISDEERERLSKRMKEIRYHQPAESPGESGEAS